MGSDVSAVLVAHQGGWDEAVFVALPMVVLVLLLGLARRRAEREAAAEAEAATRAEAEARTEGPAHEVGARAPSSEASTE